jgi:hypothetical protein
MPFLAVLMLAVLSPAVVHGQAPPGAPPAQEEKAPPEKTSKEVDVGRTIELLPSKIVLAPVSLLEAGTKRTLNFIEGEHLVDKVDYYLRYLNDRGIFPSAYDLGDGSGVGVGVEARRSPGGRVCLGAAAGVTTKLYQSYQAQAALPLYDGDLLLSARAGYQYRPEEEFYGIGPTTTQATQTNYLVEDGFAEGGARLGCERSLQVALSVRGDTYKTDQGKDSSVPSIQEEFGPAQAPGLFESINFVSTGFIVSHDDRDWPEVPTSGGHQRLGAWLYHDASGKHFDFYRASLELEQILPISTLKHVFLVRAYAEVNQPLSDKDQIPFFLLARLGGSYWLRGFHELRFYDERAVTWSLEYRYRIWGRAEAFLYVDQGEVFGRSQGFSAAQIATSGGGGFMIRRFHQEHSEDIISGGPGYVALRERLFLTILVGGSGEGVRPFITFGAFL